MLVATDKFLNVRISPADKEVIDQTFADMGMKQIEGVSRLMRWFATLDEDVRYAIVGPDSLRPKIARMVLERMASGDEARQGEADCGDDEAGGSTADLPPGGPSSSGGDVEPGSDLSDAAVDAADEQWRKRNRRNNRPAAG